MDLLSVFLKLDTLSSVKDKEALLKANEKVPFLKEFLEANLNPHKLYQFNKAPEYVVHQCGKLNAEQEFLDLLTQLNNRIITGNTAKEAVRQFLMSVHAEDAGLYERILLKSPIGIGASTVNKVWPDLIPEFKLMLAPNKQAEVTNLTYKRIVQPKLDGYRCLYIDGLLYTRKGLTFGNRHLSHYFINLDNAQNYVFDGELYIKGMSFNELQKILNNHSALLPKDLKFVVFDCMPLKDWRAKNCKMPYKERLTLLRSLLNDKVADPKKVIDIASDEVDSSAEAVELYKDYLKQGYEGVMLKDINGLYRWKRTTLKSGEMLKLKPFTSEDLKVIDIYDGEGEFEGKAGGIVVDFNSVAVRCGSGFDIPTREDMARNKAGYIGKTAEIKYFEVTEDGSLRFPIFKAWREDK